MDGAEQGALRDRAAQAAQVRHRLAHQARCFRHFARGVGRQAMGQRHDAIGPEFALERLGARGAILEARQHLGDGAALAGARQPVEVVDVVEGGEMLVQARLQVGREVGPAPADLDAPEFEPRQQGDGIGLVLAELLPHAPHALVMERQRLVGSVEVDQEQREVPPVVRLHERIAVAPGVGHGTEEGDALQHAAARLQAMGDGVMRPRVVAVERQPVARRGLGLVEAIALLEAERIHAPDEAIVRVGGEQLLADLE